MKISMLRKAFIFLRNTALGLGSVLAVLAAVELCARGLWGRPSLAPLPQGFQYNYTDTLTPFFKPAERLPGGYVLYKSARVGAAPETFVMPKLAGDYRIMIIGGSVAVPIGEFRQFWPIVEKLFGPRHRVELITCGMPGYDSGQSLDVLHRILRYKPNLIIDMDGNNEYGRTEMTPLQIRLYLADRAMSRLWIYRGFKKLIRAHLDAWDAGTPVPAGTTELNFERNLRSIVQLCRSHGVRIVLCTLPANLRDMPPMARAPRWSDRVFFMAMQAYQARDNSRAAALFNAYLGKHPTNPAAHYYLGRTLERLRHPREAVRQYDLAADWDKPGSRTPPDRNADIRRIARREGVPLADLARLLGSWAKLPGAPGDSLFFDNCHVWAAGNPILLQDILSAAFPKNQKLKVTAKEPSSWLPRPFPTVHMLLAAAGEITLPVANQGENLSEVSIELMRRAYRANPRLFMRTLMAPKTVLKKSLWPWDPGTVERMMRQWPFILSVAGEMFRREGRYKQALFCAKRSLKLAPGGEEALLVKALALNRLGQQARARAILRRLVRAHPDQRDILLWAKTIGA